MARKTFALLPAHPPATRVPPECHPDAVREAFGWILSVIRVGSKDGFCSKHCEIAETHIQQEESSDDCRIKCRAWLYSLILL